MQSEKVRVVHQIAIFSQVPDTLLDQIAEELVEVSLPSEYPLIRQGDAPDAIYILREGRVSVHLGEVVIREMVGPCIIGEFAVLLGEPRTASITTLEPCKLYRLEARVFQEKFLRSVELTTGILKSLAGNVIREGEKNQRLMQNMLPFEVAEELRNRGEAAARSYPKVSVLFTDFKGFTALTQQISPQKLIRELNDCFSHFDDITARYRMEKIKTSGDAYMCAGGVPTANQTNPVEAVLAGLAIQQFLTARSATCDALGLVDWHCRLGIHTGEVIAGVIGKHKFAYDIWGDTVNTASRMESCGEVGRVNISEATFREVDAFFVCSPRGALEAKGKGKVEMYFVDHIRPDLSIDGQGLEPNEAFHRLLAAREAEGGSPRPSP